MAPRDDAPAPDDPGALDALRRRVYGPGATDEDRERLRAAGASASPAVARPIEPADDAGAPPLEAPSSRRRPTRRSSLLLPGAVVAVVVVVAVVLGLVSGVLTPPGPTPRPATALAVDGDERSELVDNLLSGGAAGLSAYLVTHPSPPGLRTATRFDTVEREGVGAEDLRIAKPADSGRGRATVLLVLASGGDAGWRVQRSTSGTARFEQRGGQQEAGVPTTATFALPAAETTVRLHVDAPGGVRWGVAVVFSD